jgi:hypothetical protein
VCAGSCDSEGIVMTWFDTRIQEARMERELETAIAGQGGRWVAIVAGEIRAALPVLKGYTVHRVPTASWVRPKFVERLFALGVRGVLVVRDARAEASARDGGRWVEARLMGQRTPVLRTERAAGGTWSVVDFDPSRPSSLVQAAEEFRGGVRRRSAPSRRTGLIASMVIATAVTAAAVAPSDLRVTSPAAATPELVLSFKAFGARGAAASVAAGGGISAPALDPSEAAKPIHMRGVITAKPHREDVVVRLTVDGVTESRAFPAKGFSHDGPAIGEWRRSWRAGEHRVAVEVVSGGSDPVARWEGTLRAIDRRLNVILYDPTTGFVIE